MPYLWREKSYFVNYIVSGAWGDGGACYLSHLLREQWLDGVIPSYETHIIKSENWTGTKPY